MQLSSLTQSLRSSITTSWAELKEAGLAQDIVSLAALLCMRRNSRSRGCHAVIVLLTCTMGARSVHQLGCTANGTAAGQLPSVQAIPTKALSGAACLCSPCLSAPPCSLGSLFKETQMQQQEQAQEQQPQPPPSAAAAPGA
jgi:hypothetical protein